MTFIKCYRALYYDQSRLLNEEESPCNQCLKMLDCMELEKLLRRIKAKQKALLKEERLKVRLKKQYICDVIINEKEEKSD